MHMPFLLPCIRDHSASSLPSYLLLSWAASLIFVGNTLSARFYYHWGTRTLPRLNGIQSLIMIPNSSWPPTGSEEAISQAGGHHSDSQGEVPPLPKALGYKMSMEHLASLAAMHSSWRKPRAKMGSGSLPLHTTIKTFLYFRVDVTQYFLFSVKGFSTHLRRNNLIWHLYSFWGFTSPMCPLCVLPRLLILRVHHAFA